MSNVSFVAPALLFVVAVAIGLLVFQVVMFFKAYVLPILAWFVAPGDPQSTNGTATNVSLSWYAPNASQINNLGNVINGTGVYGFGFGGSDAVSANTYYGGYNWYLRPIFIQIE